MSAKIRPTWDEYFMEIARQVAQRSTCPRASVGAVIVRERRILTTGYNGAPEGLLHCLEAGCIIEDDHCQRSLHAEQNAIIQAAMHGVSIQGGQLYCTTQPCVLCAKMIINAGIERVVFAGDYPDSLGKSLLEEARVDLVRLDDSGEPDASRGGDA